jgi:S1-C subfamily serine protease
MRKMLAIVGSMVLCAAAAWAAPDRSSLSFEENVTINSVCLSAAKRGNGAFQSCIAEQMAQLHDHPTPDLSALSPSRVRAIEIECGYLRRQSIGTYNDCAARVIAAPQKSAQIAPDDELASSFANVFTETATDTTVEKPQATPAAATTLPAPAAALMKRPDHIEQKELSSADVFKKVQRSVFVVVATQSLAEARVRNVAQGSAIAVDEHLLLTNCHVVKDRSLIKLVQDGKRANATLVGGDYATDRCVLRTDEITLTPIGGVRMVDSLGVGEHVFAVGAPLSLELTLSEGLISGIRHGAGRTLVQTSAALGHGSSGGGLFDARGNLVGITTLASFGNTAQNLNFAIAAADFWR